MNNYKKRSAPRQGFILFTIHGLVDGEVLRTRTAQSIIKILTSRSTAKNKKAKEALLEFNEECKKHEK